jgi:hypothetical protein
MPEPDSTRRCPNPGHRVIPIRFPYVEAEAIRAKLVSQLGAERVSCLRGSGAPWTVVICTECARDDVGGADGDTQVGP